MFAWVCLQANVRDNAFHSKSVNDCDVAINVSTYCAFPIESFAALSSATFVRGNSMQEPPLHNIMSSIVIYFIYRQAVNALSRASVVMMWVRLGFRVLILPNTYPSLRDRNLS